jgi:hypothetical protein
VRARSGLRSTDPTAGGAPPGRYSAAVAGKAAKRAALVAVWSAKVWSTTKPRSATRMAGRSTLPRGMVP